MSNPGLYPPEVVYLFGPFRLDLSRGLLLRDYEPVALTPKLLDTLLVLIESRGRIVSRQMLVEKVWPDTIVSDTSITQNIFLLRKILGDDAIETVPRRGYRFVLPVVLEHRKRSEPTIRMAAPPPPASDVPAAPEPAVQAPRPRSHLRIIAALAAVIVLAVAAGWLLHEWRLRRRTAFARTVMSLRQPALVAAPFVNERRTAEDAWLRTALPRMLADQLAGERLRVTPAETAIRMPLDLRLADATEYAPETAARIGRYAGADLILAGSFTALGDARSDQVTLTARIQESRKGEVVAVASAVGAREQLFRLVENVSADLRAQLGIPEPATDERRRAARYAAPASLDAARLYARGVEELHRYNLISARDLLLQAVKSDPAYAPSHRALCDVFTKLAETTKAKESATLALQHARDLPRAQQLEIEAVYSQAHRDFAKAVETRRTLANFYPDNVDYGLDLVAALFSAQRLPEALEAVRALRAKHPSSDDPRIDFAEANVHVEMGTWAEASRVADRAAVKLRNGGSRILLARALSVQGRAQQQEGDDRWWATQQECLAVSRAAGFPGGELRALNTLAIGYAEEEQADKGLSLLRTAEALAKKIGDVRAQIGVAGNMAYVSSEAGRWEEARQAAERVIPLARAAGDKANEAILINMLAHSAMGSGDYAAARRHASDALGRMRALSRKSGVATSLATLGRIALMERRLDDAQSQLGESLKLFEEIGSRETKTVGAALARVTFEQGRLSAARTQAAGINHADARLVLARIALAEGKANEAMTLLAKDTASAEAQALRALAASRLGRADEARSLGAEALRLVKPSQHAHEVTSLRIAVARATGDGRRLDALAREAAARGDVLAAR